jgi:coenzyme PQQ precursor peptide PqqA
MTPTLSSSGFQAETAGARCVAKRKERVGHFIFQPGYCVGGKSWIFFCQTIHGPNGPNGGIMEWTAPAFEEICLNCEINSYASAKL